MARLCKLYVLIFICNVAKLTIKTDVKKIK